MVTDVNKWYLFYERKDTKDGLWYQENVLLDVEEPSEVWNVARKKIVELEKEAQIDKKNIAFRLITVNHLPSKC